MRDFFDTLKIKIKNLISSVDDVELVDLLISNLIKTEVKKLESFKEFSFFSEEDKSSFSKKKVIILDPIDGTREFRANIPECCVSLSILNSLDFSDLGNIHWVWNFFNNSESLFLDGKMENINIFEVDFDHQIDKKQVLISKGDYSRLGLEKFSSNSFELVPIGSIAYKLHLLAAGQGDAVLSVSPKNIWDICAGSMMCHLAGKLSNLGLNFSGPELINGPMYWCNEDFDVKELVNELEEYF